jgi:serine/threonine-protein kinase RsbW
MTERLFPAVVPVVPEAVSWARAQADDARLPEARGLDLELAVEEALMNICLHAYGGRGGDLTLRTGRTGEGFVLEIEDSGPPFDPLSVAAPDTSAPLEARQIGGFGILLVRRVTDVVRWRRDADHNVLTLVFASQEPPGETGLFIP